MPEVILKTNTEAQAHFLKELGNKWEDCGQWMGVLFRVKDGKIELSIRTTYSFPINDCLAAIGLLASNLHQEVLAAGSPLAERPPALPKYKPMSNEDAAEIIKHGPPLQDDGPVERYKDVPFRKTFDEPDTILPQQVSPNVQTIEKAVVDKEQQGSILPYPRPEKDEL